MKKQNIKILTFLFAILTLAGLSLHGSLAFAAPATFTVTNTNDSGAGSLRQAIIDANSNNNPSDLDVIEFNIPGTGVHTITPITDLPYITEKVSIDGVSAQSGATCGDPSTPRALKIFIDGVNVTAAAGLHLGVGSEHSSIRGVAVGNVPFGSEGSGIADGSGGNNTFTCNNIGTNAEGTVAQPNGAAGIDLFGGGNSTVGGKNNVSVGGACTGDCNLASGNGGTGIALKTDSNTVIGNYACSDITGVNALPNGTSLGGDGIGVLGGNNNIIGDSTPAGRNVVGGCSTGGSVNGIAVEAGSGNIIRGNYVGLAPDGITSNPNDSGISLVSVSGTPVDNNIIGGTNVADRNVVSSNTRGEVNIVSFGSPNEASGNIVAGNYIGTDKNGQFNSSYNAPSGVAFLGDASNNIIGGVTAGSGNLIVGHTNGVTVLSVDPLASLNNSILGNSIYHNGIGGNGLGIDLSTDTDFNFVSDLNAGPTPNDVGDTDSGSNNYLNKPEISSVSSSGNSLTITYSLDINDNEVGATGYRVEFFANDALDASGQAEGQSLIGSDNVTGDVTNRTVTLTNTGLSSGSYQFSATTTITDASADGFGSTSEFGDVHAASVIISDNGASVNPAASGTGSGPASLASTGSNQVSAVFIALALVVGSIFTVVGLKKSKRGIKQTKSDN